MRKSYFSIFAVVVIVIAFFIVGCAKKAQPETVEIDVVKVKPPTTVAVPAPAPTPAPVVQTQALLPNLDDEIKAFQEKIVYFDFDRFDLRPEAQETINQQANFLKANQSITIQIAGNCDERGTVEYNLALGEKRAKAAQDYLLSLGVTNERISTISYGKEKPVDPGKNEEAWAKNRNDQFVVVSK
jgi:peptidoglycan-associated lipoprotein